MQLKYLAHSVLRTQRLFPSLLSSRREAIQAICAKNAVERQREILRAICAKHKTSDWMTANWMPANERRRAEVLNRMFRTEGMGGLSRSKCWSPISEEALVQRWKNVDRHLIAANPVQSLRLFDHWWGSPIMKRELRMLWEHEPTVMLPYDYTKDYDCEGGGICAPPLRTAADK